MFNFAKKIHNVPSMGDSISEGTILEYTKKVGDYVE
jgi:pyruvate/2-oxoglutarate dehydrogenase complex dihydrolipoamide acyltransferase (E2) component